MSMESKNAMASKHVLKNCGEFRSWNSVSVNFLILFHLENVHLLFSVTPVCTFLGIDPLIMDPPSHVFSDYILS